jgi:hypothetical protein
LVLVGDMRTMNTRNTRFRNRRRGLALVEVLICSSIAAMMLTATAIAFRASIGAYRDNSDRNILLSHGRIAMRQLINEIRQADVHGALDDALVPNASYQFAGGLTTENGGIVMTKQRPDADEPNVLVGNKNTWVHITWQLDAANHRITRTRSVGISGAPDTSTVALYVQDFKVRMEPACVASGNVLLRAVVTMTMRNDDGNGKMLFNQGNGLVTERIIDAAVPRKNFSGL